MDPAIAALSVLLAAASVIDLRTHRIPNLLVGFGIALGFTLFHSSLGWFGVRLAAEGIGVAFALFVPLFLLRALGAGDVKLMMVVGSFLGPMSTLQVGLLAFAVSGVLALVDAAAGRRMRSLLQRTKATAFALALRDATLASSLAQASANRIPFAVAVLIGAAIWLFYFY